MNVDLSGKKALVCGGSSGIGLASAQALASLGAGIVLLARNQDSLAEALGTLPNEGARHGFVVADFNDRENLTVVLDRLIERSPVHILINNTGGPPAGLLYEATLDELRNAFGQHVLAAQTLVHTVLPGMRKTGYGRIINIISTSVKQPIPGLGVSNTIRGAMANWAKTLAGELAPAGITVNNVLPGSTETDRLTGLIQRKSENSGMTEAEVIAEMKAKIPMGRFADPAELGAAVAFLASPAASYITGTNIVVDGGRTGCL